MHKLRVSRNRTCLSDLNASVFVGLQLLTRRFLNRLILQCFGANLEAAREAGFSALPWALRLWLTLPAGEA